MLALTMTATEGPKYLFTNFLVLSYKTAEFKNSHNYHEKERTFYGR